MVTEPIESRQVANQMFGVATRPVGYAGKRAFDLIVSGLVVVFFLSWLMPLIGLSIALSSPGPVLFVQVRSGRNGRQFRCFKFRTMRTDLPGSTVFRQASRNDPRITSVGRFLRRTNMDELPQLLNVLLGDMSLVGPRPHPIELDAQYWHRLPGYSRRYELRPGITGLAQVSRCRGAVTSPLMMKRRVRYDRLYSRNVSLTFDLYICLRTLSAMLSGNTDAF